MCLNVSFRACFELISFKKSPFQYCSCLLTDSLVLIYLSPSQTNFAGPHPRLIVLVRPRKMRRRRIKEKQSRGMVEIAVWRRISPPAANMILA